MAPSHKHIIYLTGSGLGWNVNSLERLFSKFIELCSPSYYCRIPFFLPWCHVFFFLFAIALSPLDCMKRRENVSTKAGFMGTWPVHSHRVPLSEGPVLGLMFCCCRLEVCSESCFPIWRGPCKRGSQYCRAPCSLKGICCLERCLTRSKNWNSCWRIFYILWTSLILKWSSRSPSTDG